MSPGRIIHTNGTNLRWLERAGGDGSIHDTGRLRDEPLQMAFGIWGYILQEQEMLASGLFEDVAAYGSWPLDGHNLCL